METTDLMAELLSRPMTHTGAPRNNTPPRTAAEAVAALDEALDTTAVLSDRAKRNLRSTVEKQVRDQVREHERTIVHQAQQFAKKVQSTADEMESLDQEIGNLLDELRDDPAASTVEVFRRFSRLKAEAGKRYQTASTFVDSCAGQMEALGDPLANLSAVQERFVPLRRHYGI